MHRIPLQSLSEAIQPATGSMASILQNRTTCLQKENRHSKMGEGKGRRQEPRSKNRGRTMPPTRQDRQEEREKHQRPDAQNQETTKSRLTVQAIQPTDKEGSHILSTEFILSEKKTLKSQRYPDLQRKVKHLKTPNWTWQRLVQCRIPDRLRHARQTLRARNGTIKSNGEGYSGTGGGVAQGCTRMLNDVEHSVLATARTIAFRVGEGIETEKFCSKRLTARDKKGLRTKKNVVSSSSGIPKYCLTSEIVYLPLSKLVTVGGGMYPLLAASKLIF